jgi:hypothetical protein
MKSIKRYARHTVWEDLTEQQIIQRYVAGETLDGLAMLTGTGSHRIRQFLVANGVEIRPRFGRKRKK